MCPAWWKVTNMLQSEYFLESKWTWLRKNPLIVKDNGGLGSGLILCELYMCVFGSLWEPDMAPPPFPIPRVPITSTRALPPVPPFKITNGHFQSEPTLQRFPSSLVSIPTPIPTVPPPLPKPNPSFSFPQKNLDSFPTFSCKEEIYVSSSSVIELDCSSSTNNDGSDSGIYNASTTTGISAT